ncbi:hypothetical protein F3Y30_19370 [Sinorhizobium sp. BG8]|nr:hypothetical protein F3Y30_19370 [Sinorhizobium sp. BG8]
MLIFSRSEDGHRAQYFQFAMGILGGCRARAGDLFFRMEPALFLMVEEGFLFYVVACLWRSALGRRTVGLLFRPKPVLEGGSLRLSFKRCALKLLKRIPSVRTLTILPFATLPEMAEIADGWIYDFQLWDLTDEDHRYYEKIRQNPGEAISQLPASLRFRAGSQRVLSAFGPQDLHKGFDLFVDTLAGSKRAGLPFHFVFGGKSGIGCIGLVSRFERSGGSAIDRWLSEEEWIELYAASDLVWCLYAPGYDQASGVLGRAVQFGVPVLVREGSLSHRLCETEGIPHLAATAESVSALLARDLSAVDHRRGKALAGRFAETSLTTLHEVLGAPRDRAA